MDLTEAKGKALFAQYGLPVASSLPVATPEEAERAVRQLGHAVLKVQVPTGHRGKRGGIVEVNPGTAAAAARELLGKEFDGYKVEQLLAESFVRIAHEWYLALTINRELRALELLFSSNGGVDVEQLTSGGELLRLALPLDHDGTRRLGQGLPAGLARQLHDTVQTLLRLMREYDATLVEVNPLAVTPDKALVLLDSKVTIDDSALFRHPELAPRATETMPPTAVGLSYVPLGGEIAVIGNGAGLVMATLDLLDRAGGSAANFLDVGGGARADVVLQAMGVVLAQPAVRGLLVNIYGGITRADEVANGIVRYAQVHPLKLPLVVRLTGNREDQGRTILRSAGIEAASSMEQAAERIVQLTRTA